MNFSKILSFKQENVGKVCFFSYGLKYLAFNEDAYLLEKMTGLDCLQDKSGMDYVRFPKQQLYYYSNRLKEFGHEVITIED